MDPSKSDLIIDLDPKAKDMTFGKNVIKMAQKQLNERESKMRGSISDSESDLEPKAKDSAFGKDVIEKTQKQIEEGESKKRSGIADLVDDVEPKAKDITFGKDWIEKAQKQIDEGESKKRDGVSDLVIDLDPKAKDITFGKDVIEKAQKQIEETKLKTTSTPYKTLEADDEDSIGELKKSVEAVTDKITEDSQIEIKDKAKAAKGKGEERKFHLPPHATKLKQNISALRDMGFKEKIRTVSADDLKDDSIPSKEEVFRITYDKFPDALVDGNKMVPVSEMKRDSQPKEVDYTLELKFDEDKQPLKVKPSVSILDRPETPRVIEGSSESHERLQSRQVAADDSSLKETQILPHLPSRDIVVDLTEEIDSSRLVPLGVKGFVAQLLDKFLTDPLEEVKSTDKRQSRRRGLKTESAPTKVKLLDFDLQDYFEDVDDKVEAEKEAHLKKLLRKTRLESLEDKTETEITKGEEQELTIAPQQTAWKPGSLENIAEKKLEEKTPGFFTKTRSWTGAYILGTDYWIRKLEGHQFERQEEVECIIDENRPWYDLALSLFSSDELEFGEGSAVENVSARDMRELKSQIPPTEMGIARLARKAGEGFGIPSGWNDDLIVVFQHYAKKDIVTGGSSKISLPSADKWLEKSGVLDYKDLSVINTGLCFRLAGGGRYKDLTYNQFKIFLQMIAYTKNSTFVDLVKKLQVAFVLEESDNVND